MSNPFLIPYLYPEASPDQPVGAARSVASGQLVIDGAEAAMSDEPTVAQLILEAPQRAQAFEKLGINYCCCNGQQTVREACAKRGVDVKEVLTEVRRSEQATPGVPRCGGAPHWEELPLPAFIKHLSHDHHGYLRRAMSRVSYLIYRVSGSHGDFFPEFWELEGLFEEWQNAAVKHLDAEERNLLAPLKQKHLPDNATLSAVIGHSMIEHTHISNGLRAVREWTQQFPGRESTCNTFRVMLHALSELETEWARCVEEEEEILFPRAMLQNAS
jgi:regulator of cell morphogenesis and NO signaling